MNQLPSTHEEFTAWSLHIRGVLRSHGTGFLDYYLKQKLDVLELLEWYKETISQYPELVSIERTRRDRSFEVHIAGVYLGETEPGSTMDIITRREYSYRVIKRHFQK